jgi:transposase-like protein
VVALGIDSVKHPLGVEEGSTENAAVVTDLIAGLRDRGLDTGKPVLAVIDGSKALARAVKDVFAKPVIHRCQQHKIRNVTDKLPERLKSVTEKRMRHAYHAGSALKAEGELEALARELGKTHPGAAASLREGMAETLTVLRLGVPPTLARTLRSTNTIESMIEICREHSKNVKRSAQADHACGNVDHLLLSDLARQPAALIETGGSFTDAQIAEHRPPATAPAWAVPAHRASSMRGAYLIAASCMSGRT